MMKTGLLALAVFAFASSASATDNPFARDKAILNLKGLDLSTSDGQQRLAIRLDRVVRDVCGDRLATVHLALERQAQECRTAVIADVRTQIESRNAHFATSSSTPQASAR
jgi:UrcA family protein